MRLNTIITLGASAAFGLMAVFLARGWINGAVENEFRETRSVLTPHKAPIQNTVPVLVADIDFQFGDIISKDAIKIAQFPEDAVPFENFTSFEDIMGYDPNTPQTIIALTSIRKNEPILPHKISGPNGKGSLSARIKPGYRAASIRVDAVTGVSGFVVPGDIVDIIYTAMPSPDDKTQNYKSDILLQSIQVLGIDQNQSDETSRASLAKTVTLEVSHSEAQRLAVATQSGHLSLILRSLGETTPATTQPVTTAQLTHKPTRKSQSYAKVSSKPRPKIMPKTDAHNVAQITIIRGEATESVSVLSEGKDDTPPALLSTKDLAGG